jgi:shikimate kinase
VQPTELIPGNTVKKYKPIFIIGFMGSGKSYWGKIWAQASGLSFIDLDDVITNQQQQSIADIFSSKGENYFRELETEKLHKYKHAFNCIIACGGGTPCFNNNMEWMNSHGITIYLDATPQQLQQRLVNETTHRPVIKNIPPDALLPFITEKLAERMAYYKKAAITISVDTATSNTIKDVLDNA